uniref:Uncharacterized protein n=1 Tax=Rhizophora mucronata TaxID=61149 RepID=A0A2P2PJF8_RHIMU
MSSHILLLLNLQVAILVELSYVWRVHICYRFITFMLTIVTRAHVTYSVAY